MYINVGMFLFSKELIYIFADSAYSEAHIIIPIIAFSYVLGSQQRIFSTIIAFYKKNWVISTGGIIQAATNLGLNIIFIPRYGYIAAAYTTLISVFLYTFWIYFFSQFYLKISLKHTDYFKVFLLFLFVVLFHKYLGIDLSFLSRMITYGILLLFTLFLFFDSETKKIFNLIKLKFK